ncbi:MAG: ankyrin repeat domain-containing protein [Vicinamibacteria bacterium]|nr:ankyrin repeat domain-containing protein [Vicinamibacteria bacterium]
MPPALVKDFVGKAHANFEATKGLLAEHPTLLNATWDWGGGDFETGLGGASHMGNRDIAEFLIGRGARMDLFTAVMLGRLDIVTPMLSAYPALLQSRGPHGLTLLHHARKGGGAAREVLDYLDRLGAS